MNITKCMQIAPTWVLELRKCWKSEASAIVFMKKGIRNRPLTKSQIADNRKKSSVRARVEHVFGHITNSMKGFYIRTIGIVRSRADDWDDKPDLQYRTVRSASEGVVRPRRDDGPNNGPNGPSGGLIGARNPERQNSKLIGDLEKG